MYGSFNLMQGYIIRQGQVKKFWLIRAIAKIYMK